MAKACLNLELITGKEIIYPVFCAEIVSDNETVQFGRFLN